jgi:glycerol-3-phosphate dehydrogenase
MPLPSSPSPTPRAELISRLAEGHQYDIAIVLAVVPPAWGLRWMPPRVAFSVVLVESHDFAKGTSSRATKLVHGGVRYLAQGNIALVREALHERTTLLHNAPHLAQPLPFVMPSIPLVGNAVLRHRALMYDLLAGKAGSGQDPVAGRERNPGALPTSVQRGFKGGVKYWDGQFNDARLALGAGAHGGHRGALLVNYCPARAGLCS